MRERYRKTRLTICQMIVILIVGVAVVACSAPYSANVIDRAQPPSRKIQPSGIHYVSRGETLFSIAWRYGLDYKQLAQHNRIYPPYTIYPRQKIRLDVATSDSNSVKSSSQSARPSRNAGAAANGKSAVGKREQTPVAKVPQRSEIKTPKQAPVSTPPLLTDAPKWQWPAQGKVLAAFAGNGGLNKGIDISGNLGQPVFAAASGQIVYAGSGLRGYGKLLIIKHNESFLSAYAHNEHLLVKEGEMVKVGQRIADMGSSGTDRIKLHFEIRREGQPVDPIRYLPRR